jgi:hypothetical protein
LNKIEVVALKNKWDENIDDGYDYRHSKNSKINNSKLQEIKTSFIKQKILFDIVNKDISLIIKIKTIEENLDAIFNKSNPYLHNLLEGGLMNDFEFKIDEFM